MPRKYSSEYKALQPYVVEDIRKVVNASSAAGTAGGTLEQHALNSWYHTGELAQTQASWAATKIELSNHAALPDVHHARSHSIISSSDHTVTGSQYQIIGLTSTNTLGLLTAASSPTAHQVVKTDASSMVTLVDLTVTSDLFVTGYLDFGTNTMYEDASYLYVTGSKAVRFAQNIGNANWTVYNAGGAQFGGNVDIISGGDLTVAGSGSYAGNTVLFADSSGGNVGIMMAPDSQFALDINGPARATYWIGPHALQIKDAIMICHYDGRQPFNTNFYGEPNGHFGQVATVTGGVVYMAGKFGKAVSIATGTTNLFSDPSCEYDANLTQWTDFTSAGTFTSTRSTEVEPLYGTYTGKLVCSASASGLFYQSLTPTAGAVVVTAYVRKADKSAITSSDCNVYIGADRTTTYTSIGDGWYRLRATTTASGSATQIGLRVLQSKTLYVDGLMCEPGRSMQGPYCDGSMGTGHAWSNPATPNVGSSTRTSAALSYTLPTIDYAAPATIMAWVNLDTTTPVDYQYLWYPNNDSYAAYRNASGTLVVGTVGCGALPAGWVHVALTTDGAGTNTAYVNGVSKGTASITRDYLTTWYVGIRASQYRTEGFIDDFAIIGRALPAAEIRSIYESNAPIFAETSTFSFRPTPKGLIWADDEGLWMRDSAGSPIFGIYGGDTTKSWGGFTMAPGDLLMGNNAVGAAAILWDQSAGTFGFYGAGNATAQASVATDGSITAGAGALALNSSGIQITAPSTQTAIGSYKFLVTGKTITSGMYAYYNSGADTYYHGLYSDSSNIGNITTVIGSNLGGGGTSKIQFAVSNNLTVTSTEYTLAGSGIATLWIGSGDTNYVGIGTAAAPTRPFQVNGGLFAGGENTGLAGYVQLTNSTQGVSSGTGTVKLNGTTARDSVGWLKLTSGTTAIYVPYWTTVTG